VTHPSLASSPRGFRDAATCTICAAPPPVLMPDWETLARLASKQSKPLDLNTCPTPSSFTRQFYGTTDKPYPAWFLGPNQETIMVISWPKSPNHSYRFWGINRETHSHRFWGQTRRTVDLGFEAKSRNLCSSSPCARCRPKKASPDLSIIRPQSTWPSPVLYIRSPTPAMILIAIRHAAPITCTPWDKQIRFSTQDR
jgi:hypothetical protein